MEGQVMNKGEKKEQKLKKRIEKHGRTEMGKEEGTVRHIIREELRTKRCREGNTLQSGMR